MKDKKELIQYGALCAALLFFLFHYWEKVILWTGTLLGVLKPLLIGGIVAYILNLILSFYERTILKNWKYSHGAKRALSILLSLITLIGIITLIITMIVPELRSCIEILIQGLPMVYDSILDFLNSNPELLTLLPDLSTLQLDFQQIASDLINWLGSGVGASIFGYLSSFVSVIFNVFVTLVFAIYLLAGKEWLIRQTKRLASIYLPTIIKKKGLHVLHTLDHCFHRFIVGQCLEAIILGLLCILGMWIFRFPYAVMIGILIGATALIPIFGAYIGGAVGFILIFTESPTKALFFIVFLLVLQQLENQLIYPRVVGNSIGLPGILVFTAVAIGAGLFGFVGILLGIPLTATAYRLLKADVQKRESLK